MDSCSIPWYDGSKQIAVHATIHSQALEDSVAEAAMARSMATALQREVALLRRQEEQDKLRMEAMVGILPGPG
jgi:hypothetical protein